MSTDVNVSALAKLARLEISEEETARLEKEIPAILGFVEMIQKVPTDDVREVDSLRNVLRKDENPHESGLYTDALMQAAPVARANKIVVKQVITKKKKDA
jgi:aspartyl-tRNA(Asn)/glutamyl-tRNA(Gln) amidotransferase subunit C